MPADRIVQAPKTEPLLSIIVCTRNRAKVLEDCLRSLLDQGWSSSLCELVVVDDGSTDGTRSLVESLRAEASAVPITYRYQQHGGVNAARNTGILASRGELVLFFDDDELAPAGYLDKIVDRFSSTSDLDGLGGPVRDCGEGLRTCSKCSLGDAHVRVADDGLAIRLLGGNMALRRSLFDEVGMFDAELSGLGDDNEWFYRARGRRFLFDPELWVHHRRDWLGLGKLCRIAFVQGMALPQSLSRLDGHYRPSVVRVFRFLGHALRRWCANGLSRASEELGALYGHLRPPRSAGQATSAEPPPGGP